MQDNYSLWEFKEAKKEAWLQSRPVCEHCGQPIQEDWLFNINGVLYHPACAAEVFERSAEDYTR